MRALAPDFTDPHDILKEILPKEKGQKQSKTARKLILSGDEYILARKLNQKNINNNNINNDKHSDNTSYYVSLLLTLNM